MYACPQCLPRDIVPIRSWTWTWTLRPPGIRSQTSTIPYHHSQYIVPVSVAAQAGCTFSTTSFSSEFSSAQFSSFQFRVQFSSVQFSSVQFSSIQFSSPLLATWPQPRHGSLQLQGKFQLLPPAPPYYSFPRGIIHTRGNIWRVTVADMNAATPPWAWGRSVISLVCHTQRTIRTHAPGITGHALFGHMRRASQAMHVRRPRYGTTTGFPAGTGASIPTASII